MIRNKIGFHSDVGFAKKMLAAIPDDTEMVEYIGRQLGDTLYFGSEVLHYQALKKITGETDDLAAFGAAMDELRKLQNLFLDFVSAVVRVFALRHLPQFAKISATRSKLTDLPRFKELRLPYFVDFSPSAVPRMTKDTRLRLKKRSSQPR